ncbi:MarR family winged helix-turn-helix transcriptional regulator [Serinicoccus sediminis]|uniref:MarR family winged helix-turn-helix transcriptional regulator n=1 Tax=Serinicoccus sediminis TaxID=2306021 RepID=UPI00102174CF|nr:MarR family transcriptional regulator [Serinicoccus sediminis]
MVRWLDDEEQRAWRSILRGSHLVRLLMEEALDEFGLSLGEYEVLSMVSEAPGGQMRMAELAHLVVQSRSRVSHTASRLEKRGWVERVPAPQDRRGVVLVLTDAGRGQLEKLAPVHVESVRRAFIDHLTRQELVEHGDIMRRVVLATRHRDDEASDAV